MRKIATTITVIALLLTAGITISSCGAGTFLQTVGSGGTLANVFTSVIGLDKVTEKGLVGTWKYEGPGCAFTSENLLAKAGGEVAATKAEQELAPYFRQGLQWHMDPGRGNSQGVDEDPVAHHQLLCQARIQGYSLAL